jgi:hypothetical protein
MKEQSHTALAERFDAIHDLIYVRGGIRPVNAAIEELGKYLLMVLWLSDEADAEVNGNSIGAVLGAPRPDEAQLKAVFSAANCSPRYQASIPGGGSGPLWPTDEPLRMTQPEIAREVLDTLASVVAPQSPTSDPLGLAFDVFLRGRYDHAGGLGTYLTPEPVTRVMAKIALGLVDPFAKVSGETRIVYGDPCAGTGRFLVSMLRECEAHYGSDSPDDLQTWAAGMFGSDQSASSISKARLNLMLYGVARPHVFTVEDSVTSPELDRLRGSLKLILTNPPFGDGKYRDLEGISRARQVIPELPLRDKMDPALAFVARCLDLLDDGGVAGIILPDGLIDNRSIRRMLERQALPIGAADVAVEGVVSLPKATFAPSGTVAKTSMIFLRRQRKSSGFIFLGQSEHVGFTKAGGKIVADPNGNDLPRISEIISKGQGKKHRKLPAIASEDPLVIFQSRTGALMLDPMRSRESIRASQSITGVPLSTLVKEKNGPRVPPSDSKPYVSVLHVDDLGCLSWHEVLAHKPTTPGNAAVGGDIVISLLNPSKMRATVIPLDAGEVIVSPEFGVFEAVCDPYAIVGLLYRPDVASQLAPLGRGTSSSRRRISEQDVLSVVVPSLDATEMAELADQMRHLSESVRSSRMELVRLFGRGASS